ncbi:nitroreductase family protein [Desulfocurvus sp. DL9XJH121]
MDALEAIHTRRSIRKFTGGPVSGEQMETLLRAAMAAPSAGNAQPWQFVVLTDRAVMDKVPNFHQYAAMIREASAAVLVCGDLSLEKYPGFWVQDCAAAVQNLLLAARAMGLGAVWTGIYPDEARVQGARELFGLPGNVVPLALIPVGPTEQPSTAKDRYRPERVHANRWEG